MRYLIHEKGYGTNFKLLKIDNLFYRSIKTNNYEIILEILALKPNINKKGVSAYSYAKDLKMLKYLMDLGVDPNQLDLLGQTVLFKLAQEGRLEEFKFMFLNGANPHIIAKNGMNLIHYSKQGDVDMMDYLLSIAVSHTQKDNAGKTKLDYWSFPQNVDNKLSPL